METSVAQSVFQRCHQLGALKAVVGGRLKALWVEGGLRIGAEQRTPVLDLERKPIKPVCARLDGNLKWRSTDDGAEVIALKDAPSSGPYAWPTKRC